MPSGAVHKTATVALGIGLLPWGFYYPEAVWIAAGTLAGLVLQPDLDQVDQRPVTTIWQLYWWPYGKLIQHRHPLSHWPVIGTAFRLLYLAPLWISLWYIFDYFKWRLHTVELIQVMIGLALADALHWLLDILFTGVKKWIA